MRKFTRPFALLLSLCLLLSAVACSTSKDKAPESPAPSESLLPDNTEPSPDASEPPVSEEPSEEPDFPAGWSPVTLTDQAGREVTIEEKPERIVSCYYISTSLVIALGLEDQLVGVEAKADKRNIYSLAAPQLIDLPNTGSMKEFNLEGCIAMEPDLVIMPLKLADHAETLSDLGISVLLVNPESGKLLNEMITLVGQATGTVEQAESLLKFSADKADQIASLVSDVTERPSVYLAGNSDMLSTATAGMYQNSLIVDAGGTNVASEIQDTYWATISHEQLLAWDPDYIVIVPEASYTVEDVLNTEALSGLRAIQNGNVFAMPASLEAWDSPVPSGILGNLWMLNLLHADLYSNNDLVKDVQDFYQTFYGFEVDPAALNRG